MNRDEINKEIVEAFGRALLRSSRGLGQAVEFYLREELERAGLVICTKNYIEELEEFKANKLLDESIDQAAKIRSASFVNNLVAERLENK